VILELNRFQPRVLGQVTISLDDVTDYYEKDYELTQISLSENVPTDTEIRIADNVAELIPNGATIQLGIGAIPDVVSRRLIEARKENLGIHSENFSDTFVDLLEAGVIDNSRKTDYRGVSVCALAVATDRAYRFLDDNPGVAMLPMHFVNDPQTIARNPTPIAVNATLAVDLTGQCASETIGAAHYSGTGGQWEFIHGANHSKDGRGILTLASTAKGGAISTIATMLAPGSAVTIPRNDAPTIVTEYGVADLRGRSIRDRANSLIAIAHPKFRDKLRHEARAVGFL
jgi:acyl-CoA hydrolase